MHIVAKTFEIYFSAKISTTFLHMSFILISSSWPISFQGSKWAVVISGGNGYDCVALGSLFVSVVDGDVSF